MTDEKFQEFIRRAGPEYRRPPETPKEEMWARIQASRAQRAATPRARRILRWEWGGGLAIAALLVLGFGLGRFTARPAQPTATAVASEPAVDSAVFDLAAADYLRQTDTFLATFLVEARSGRADQSVGEWARDLLTTARLILDTPGGNDPQLRQLLEDLELVLMQIVNYTDDGSASELQFIEDGLDEGAVQLRLRATLSEDGETTGTIGAD